MANIHKALRAGISITNRLNYTQATVDSLIDVVDAYDDLTDDERALLSFDFQQVWQEGHLTDVHDKALKLADSYRKMDYEIHVDKQYNSERCRSDADNQIEVNYDGKLYSCTGRDPDTDECEGYVAEDGTLVWNDRHRLRMAIKYGNETCRRCRIYPICHGLCSQVKLEAGGRTDCIRGIDDARRNQIVLGRVDYLLKNCNERGQATQTITKSE